MRKQYNPLNLYDACRSGVTAGKYLAIALGICLYNRCDLCVGALSGVLRRALAKHGGHFLKSAPCLTLFQLF